MSLEGGVAGKGEAKGKASLKELRKRDGSRAMEDVGFRGDDHKASGQAALLDCIWVEQIQRMTTNVCLCKEA